MFANMKQAYIFITKTNIKKSLLTLFDINKIGVSMKCDFYVNKKASEAFNVILVTNYGLNKNFTIADQG